MDVTLPDGTVIRGVPDGMSKADLTAKLKGNGYDVSKLESSPQAAPTPTAEPSLLDRIATGAKNIVGVQRDLTAGAVRGAGSIGATLLSPIDAAARAVNGGKPINVGGYDIAGQDRRAAMDAGLHELGADTDSLAFKGGKLGAEVAGTAGAGGLIARGAAAVPGLASAAPNLINAVRTAGMTAGTTPGLANAFTRAAGGAITGGASAGLVDPNDAVAGGVIGAALPGAFNLIGRAGGAVGSVLRGPEQSPELAKAVGAARSAGYVIPPTQANASLGNRLLEGFSGKASTAQNASARNQEVTNGLAAKALGLPPDTKLTPDALSILRSNAGKAYDAIGNSGTVTPGADYSAALDKIAAPFQKSAQGFPNAKPSPVLELVDSLRTPSFDAASAVEKIKQLRTASSDAYRSGNTDVGKASKAAANVLEDAIEAHLGQTGNTKALQDFRDARQLIAKSYSVESAVNPVTGSVDARKLASQLAKGKPLSDGLKDAAEFAARFPKAAQPIEGMGSLPQTSPLDWLAGGAVSAATHNPAMLIGTLARPAARGLALSPIVQNHLVQQTQPINLLAGPGVRQLGYRTVPLTGADQ